MTGNEPTADEAPTALARRLGPVVAAVSLLLTAGLLAWVALGESSVQLPLAEAPYSVPGELVLLDPGDGCVLVLDGTGSEQRTCDERLTGAFNARWSGQDVRVDAPGGALVVDPGGAVERAADDERDPGPPAVPPRKPGTESEIEVDGDVVRLDGEVVLDLRAPPGQGVNWAVTSPDGAWVVADDRVGRVLVAPVDGSAPPAVWGTVGQEAYVDLFGAVRWES